jgi:hypothetical protein
MDLSTNAGKAFAVIYVIVSTGYYLHKHHGVVNSVEEIILKIVRITGKIFRLVGGIVGFIFRNIFLIILLIIGIYLTAKFSEYAGGGVRGTVIGIIDVYYIAALLVYGIYFSKEDGTLQGFIVDSLNLIFYVAEVLLSGVIIFVIASFVLGFSTY